MRKLLFTALTCAILIGFVGLPLLHAVDAPADMTIEAPKDMATTQSPVTFSHQGHAKIDCKVCHHKGDTQQKCTSAGCHDSTDSKDKTSEKSFYKTFHAFNSDRSCVGCHKKEQKGPTKCLDCHPKKAS